MDSVKEIVELAQVALKAKVSKLLEENGKFEVIQYARFLTMQYYLTQDVQQEFFNIAGNKSLVRRKSLRKFLTKFGEEEELHYLIAAKDLEKLGLEAGEKPIDVYLWKTFFENTVLTRPFIRIGATCVLENIANSANSEILALISGADDLNKENTRFLIMHMHGPDAPHGDEVFEALDAVDLTVEELNDLTLGARIGKKIYLQLVDWIISGKE